MGVVVDGAALPAVWVTAGATHLRHTDAPLATLFDALDVAGVLRVLACLLLGGRVLLVAAAQSLLVLAAEALLELLQPFAWTGPCIYIPVLPAALLDVLDSPSFFLCGVTAATARAIRALPPDVLVVRLDSGDVGAVQPPLPPFPAALEAELRANIRRVLAPQRGRCDSPAWTPRTLPYPDDPDAFNERMQTVFFAFFAHMLQDCRDYVVFQNVVPKPATFFDYESFFRSQSAKDPFLAQFFSESQLFVAFVEQLPWPHGSLFDRAVAARIWELPIDDARRLLFPQNVPVVSVSIELPPPDPDADPLPTTPFRLDPSAIDQIRVKRCPYPVPPKTEPVCPVSGPQIASFCTIHLLLFFVHSFLSTQKSLQCARLVCSTSITTWPLSCFTAFVGTTTVVSQEVPQSWIAGVRTLLSDLGDESPEAQARVSTTLQSLQNRSFRQHFCLTLLEESEDPVCPTGTILTTCVRANSQLLFFLLFQNMPQTKCKVEPRTWSSLGRILCGILMADPKDYGICQLCLDVAERFFFLTPTVNSVFLTVC